MLLSFWGRNVSIRLCQAPIHTPSYTRPASTSAATFVSTLTATGEKRSGLYAVWFTDAKEWTVLDGRVPSLASMARERKVLASLDGAGRSQDDGNVDYLAFGDIAAVVFRGSRHGAAGDLGCCGGLGVECAEAGCRMGEKRDMNARVPGGF